MGGRGYSGRFESQLHWSQLRTCRLNNSEGMLRKLQPQVLLWKPFKGQLLKRPLKGPAVRASVEDAPGPSSPVNPAAELPEEWEIVEEGTVAEKAKGKRQRRKRTMVMRSVFHRGKDSKKGDFYWPAIERRGEPGFTGKGHTNLRHRAIPE